MKAIVDYIVGIMLVGVGATAVMDFWAIARKRVFGVSLPDYSLLGRWLAHMSYGRFRHDSIAAARPVRGERVLGWTAHYLIGIAFAATLLGIWGLEWLEHPTIGPALVVGIGTVAAPFLLVQPGMGAGIAGRRTPRPATARLQSLVTHAVFGVGLYASGWIARLV